MKRSVIYKILALLVGAIFLLLAINGWRDRSTAMQRASLIFFGLTNVPGKGELGIFFCTNDSTKPICFLVENFDTSFSGSWETHRLDNGDGKGSLTGEASQWLRGFIGTPSRLNPHEGKVFYVPPPVTNSSWRVRFLCVEQTFGDRIRKHTIGGVELPPDAVTSGNGDWFTGRRYKLLSAEISK